MTDASAQSAVVKLGRMASDLGSTLNDAIAALEIAVRRLRSLDDVAGAAFIAAKVDALITDLERIAKQ